MNPHRDYVSQDLGGRLHLPDAGLSRPRHETGNVATFRDGNDLVLMPGQRPIRVGHFIEEDRPHGEGVFAEEGRRKLLHVWLDRQGAHGREYRQQVPHAVDAPLVSNLFAVGELGDHLTETFRLIAGDDVVVDKLSVASKRRPVSDGVESCQEVRSKSCLP